MKKDTAKKALEAFEATGAETLFMSGKGEFFTSPNFAAMADPKYKTLRRYEVEAVANGKDSPEAKAADEEQKAKEAEAAKVAEARGQELKTALDESTDKISYLEQLNREDLNALGTQLEADVEGAQNKDAAKALIREELKIEAPVKVAKDSKAAVKKVD